MIIIIINVKSFLERNFCGISIYSLESNLTFIKKAVLHTVTLMIHYKARRCSYLTHQAIRHNRLGGFGVPEFATLRQEQLISVEILQRRAKFEAVMVSSRGLFGSQIPVATGGCELQISCIRCSYLTHQAIRPNRLGGFGVPKFATLRQEQPINVDILQL